MRRWLAILLLPFLTLAGQAEAGAPAGPVDCDDLVLAAGLGCSEVSKPGEGGFLGASPLTFVDNEGRLLTSERGAAEIIGGCVGDPPVGSRTLSQYALVSVISGPGAPREPLVSVRERCASGGAVASAFLEALAFDAAAGVLYLSMQSSDPAPAVFPCNRCGDPLAWIARIDGFTPLADVRPPAAPLCANGLDDDGDGDVDVDDAHCKSATDNDESRP